MSKTININPIGFLSFFSFLGAAVMIFFYVIGNVNLAICIVTCALLAALGVVSALVVRKGNDNPILKTLLKIILIIFTIVLVMLLMIMLQIG